MDAYSIRASSGRVIRSSKGRVEPMIASDPTRPPSTIRKYVIPGSRNVRPNCDLKNMSEATNPMTADAIAIMTSGTAVSSATTRRSTSRSVKMPTT